MKPQNKRNMMSNRTATLKEIGFEVLRFSNEEIEQDVYKVRDKIIAATC